MNAREVIAHDRCSATPATDCVTPYIGHLSNYTRLLVLYRSKKPPVLFFGHPAELHMSGNYWFFFALWGRMVVNVQGRKWFGLFYF